MAAPRLPLEVEGQAELVERLLRQLDLAAL
jgi:hypothetical protein